MTLVNQTLLNTVETIARRAGNAVMDIYARDFNVEEKDDSSPLTEADKAAHRIIVQELGELPDAMPVLSEEDVDGFAGPDAKGHYWLVDPLDGTKEFIKRNGEFTVNIALVSQGRVVLGVVLAPALHAAYVAALGLGAYKVEANGTRHRLHAAKKPEPGGTWRVVGSRSHPSPALEAWLAKLGKHETHAMGSSLKLCLVAEGRADVYPRLGPTSLWDTAAAQAVVEQAGGSVAELDGTPLNYATPTQTLNPHFVVWGR